MSPLVYELRQLAADSREAFWQELFHVYHRFSLPNFLLSILPVTFKPFSAKRLSCAHSEAIVVRLQLELETSTKEGERSNEESGNSAGRFSDRFSFVFCPL